MKKIISVLLILVMVLSLAACGKSGGGSSKGGEVVGLWGYESFEIDIEAYNKSVDEEMQITQEELDSFKSLYDMFLSGMYIEFKADGTGTLGYVAMEDEEEMEPTSFTYEGDKLTFPEDEDPGFGTFEIKDGKLYLHATVGDGEGDGQTMVMKKVASLDEVKSNMEDIMAALEAEFGE